MWLDVQEPCGLVQKSSVVLAVIIRNLTQCSLVTFCFYE